MSARVHRYRRHTGAPMTTDRIDFINENNTRRVFLRFQNMSRTREAPTPTNIFNEIGTGDSEERHFGFAGNRARQQAFYPYLEGRPSIHLRNPGRQF